MQFEQLSDEYREVLQIFNPDNRVGFYDLMPPEYYANFLKLMSEVPLEMLELLSDEEALLRYGADNFKWRPTVTEARVRYLFWHEYEAAIFDNRKMSMTNVFSLVCSPSVFRRMFREIPYRAAYLLSRPVAYEHTVKEMLLHGLGKLRGILDLPDMDERGRINTKMLDLKFKIVAMMDLRVNGAPTQRVHQITQQMAPTSAVKNEVQQLVKNADMGAIQQRLNKIKQEKIALDEQRAGVSGGIEEMEEVLVVADKDA